MLSVVCATTSTSYSRVIRFRKDKVLTCFDLLGLYKKFNFSINLLFNVDETGLSVVQRGKRQVGSCLLYTSIFIYNYADITQII